MANAIYGTMIDIFLQLTGLYSKRSFTNIPCVVPIPISFQLVVMPKAKNGNQAGTRHSFEILDILIPLTGYS